MAACMNLFSFVTFLELRGTFFKLAGVARVSYHYSLRWSLGSSHYRSMSQ